MIREDTAHKCPVCGQYMFPKEGSYKTCRVCGWVDDPVQLADPDEDRCSNYESLNEYRKMWKSGWRPDWYDDKGQ